MRVYHGSEHCVKFPEVAKSRVDLDFGKGFYVTKLKEQAIIWSKRFLTVDKTASVNIYELNYEKLTNNYHGLRFADYDEAWLDFIVRCRTGGADYQAFDFIEGNIANDRVFNTIELFFDQLIDKAECLKRLRYEKPNHQICFINQKTITDCLNFVQAETIEV